MPVYCIDNFIQVYATKSRSVELPISMTQIILTTFIRISMMFYILKMANHGHLKWRNCAKMLTAKPIYNNGPFYLNKRSYQYSISIFCLNQIELFKCLLEIK